MEKINQVIDMVEHPEKYSEAQVDDILQDEECRQTYLTMVEMRMAFDKEEVEQNLDVEHEWQKLMEHQALPEEKNQSGSPKALRLNLTWSKIAASLVGVLLLSGIAIAAVHSYNASHRVVNQDVADSGVVVPHHAAIAPVRQAKVEQTSHQKEVKHKTFDNVTLAAMLSEMAKYYGVDLEFRNAEAKQLRFYYEWNSEDALSKVVDELNHSQQMNLSLEDDELIVE